MKRQFVEVDIFKRFLDEIGDKALLERIQNELKNNLEAGPVIEGTGGARKLRVARKGSGKSGGYRVIYVDVPRIETTYLLTIYDKRVRENISHETKAAIRILVRRLKGE
jgi:hypothetical protein